MLSRLNQLFSNIFQSTNPESAIDGADDVASQIRVLIAAGKTREALELLLEKGNRDAILLMGQLNQGQALIEQGKLKYSEWQKTQARINMAILSIFTEKQELPKSPQIAESDSQSVPETPISPDFAAQIQQLIKDKELTSALDQLADKGPQFSLLHKRYTDVRRSWFLGLLSEEEWNLQVKRIEASLSHFFEEHPREKI